MAEPTPEAVKPSEAEPGSTAAPQAPAAGQGAVIGKPVMVSPVTAPATVVPDTVVKSPTTTQEEDRVAAGQRATSAMWEETQRDLAKRFLTSSLVCSTIVILAALAFPNNERIQGLALVALTFQTSTTGMIIGQYFSRTNHTKVGGGGAGER